jgi:hypothetical protein
MPTMGLGCSTRPRWIQCSARDYLHDLIASEIALRTIAAGLKYGEVEVSYNLREGTSRGLPPEKIPSVALSALRSLAALTSEFRSSPAQRIEM